MLTLVSLTIALWIPWAGEMATYSPAFNAVLDVIDKPYTVLEIDQQILSLVHGMGPQEVDQFKEDLDDFMQRGIATENYRIYQIQYLVKTFAKAYYHVKKNEVLGLLLPALDRLNGIYDQRTIEDTADKKKEIAFDLYLFYVNDLFDEIQSAYIKDNDFDASLKIIVKALDSKNIVIRHKALSYLRMVVCEKKHPCPNREEIISKLYPLRKSGVPNLNIERYDPVYLQATSESITRGIGAILGCMSATREEFHRRLDEWHAFVRKTHPSFLLESEVLDSLKDIIALGLPALPYISEVMKDKNSYPTASQLFFNAMKKITKKEFSPNPLNDIDRSNCMKNTELWLDWWEKGRFQTEEVFSSLYDSCNRTPMSLDERSQTLQSIQNLGIAALPSLMLKFQQNDFQRIDIMDMVEIIDYWTDQTLQKSMLVHNIQFESMREYCLEWWEANKEYWLIPAAEMKEK